MVKYLLLWASVVAQSLKNLPAGQETWVGSLGWEDPLEKGMPPTPVFLPGKSHGQRSLAGSIVHGVTKSQTRLRDEHFHFTRLPGIKTTPLGEHMPFFWHLLAFMPYIIKELPCWKPGSAPEDPPKMCATLHQTLRSTALHQPETGPFHFTGLPDQARVSYRWGVCEQHRVLYGRADFFMVWGLNHGTERKNALLSICGISLGSRNLDTEEIWSEVTPSGIEVGRINYPWLWSSQIAQRQV